METNTEKFENVINESYFLILYILILSLIVHKIEALGSKIK